MAAKYTLPDWIEQLSIESAVKLMLYGFYGGTAPSGGGGIPVTSGQSTTPHPVAVGASGSGNIPAGALSWAFVLLTGTGTIGGVAAPLGVPLSGGKLAANFAYTTAGGSSAFILYETAA